MLMRSAAGAMERRALLVDCEKALDAEGQISGYASRFGEVDSYGDVIERGAFRKAVKAGPARIKLLRGHDPQRIIGKWTMMKEDDVGLAVAGQIFRDIADGEESYKLMQRGALDGLSIGFRIVSDKRDKNGARIIKEVDLLEISVVAIPALASARVTNVRADDPARTGAAEFIAACRKAQAALQAKNGG